jgi:hypothetical protein
MNSELVGLHLPGVSSTPASTATEPRAWLAARGYTFTTAGGSGR